MQHDTLLAFPMSIEKESMDMDSLTSTLMGMNPVTYERDHELDAIYVNGVFGEMIRSFMAQSSSNNIASFCKYIEDNQKAFDEVCNDIQYKYSSPLNIYKADTSGKPVQVNPSTVLDSLGAGSMMEMMESFIGAGFNMWKELVGNNEVVAEQYDLVYGRLPRDKSEIVVVVDGNNEINETMLYALGLIDQADFQSNLMTSISGGQSKNDVQETYSFEEICDMKFKLVLSSSYMVKNTKTGLWEDQRANMSFVKKLVNEGFELTIVGIVRPGEDNVLSVGAGGIGYTPELMQYVLEETANSQVVKEQLANPKRDVLTGLEFVSLNVNDFDLADIDLNKIDMQYLDVGPFMELAGNIDLSQIDITNLASLTNLFNFGDMTDFQKKLMEGYLSDEQVIALKQAYIDTVNSQCSYDRTMEILGYQPKETPTSIYFYPKSFEAKDKLNEMIDYYNAQVTADGHPEYEIAPTDAIGALLTTVTKVIDIVTYVLVVFVAISLVVSSIMIGIITYISVLERTKEIGILHAIGASKSDVSRVFNAETITIGFAAGVLGIILTLILELPINLLLEYLTHSGAKAVLPVSAAFALICISVFLTFIAGLVPSSLAAKKDPVEALRTE